MVVVLECLCFAFSLTSDRTILSWTYDYSRARAGGGWRLPRDALRGGCLLLWAASAEGSARLRYHRCTDIEAESVMYSRTIVGIFIAAFVAVPLGSNVLEAQTGPRDFLAAAPATLFYTEDEMSEETKAALAKARVKKPESFDCSEWGIASESPESLVLQFCADSAVTVRSYRSPKREGQSVVIVESSRSSGRANDLSVFRFAKGQQAFAPLTVHELAEIGIGPITENDFLAPQDRFPQHDSKTVSLALTEAGELEGRPVTWMDPRWEHRKESFSVKFVWSDGRFKKVVKAAE